MDSLKSLCKKNLALLMHNPIISICLISLPFIALLFTLFAVPNYLDTDFHSRLDNTGVIYQLNNELADNSTEIQSLIKILQNKTIGVLVENFNEYPILEKINKSFFDFLMNESHGICKSKDLCKIVAFNSEIEYIRYSSSNTPIIELIDIFVFQNKIELNLYSRNFPLYSRENQLSELYNIPTLHEINYIQTFLVYFSKFLKNFAKDHKDLYPNYKEDESDKTVELMIYPMYTPKYVRLVDDHTDVYPYPVSCIVYVSNSFIAVSASFVGIFYLFSSVIIEEKQEKIRELLRFQGISTFMYILSWIVTYFFVMIIPSIIFIVMLFLIWLKWKTYTVLWCILVLLLHNLNTLSLSFLGSCVITNKNQSKWSVYIIYLASLLFYFLFQLFQEYDVWLKMIFYFFPTINFSISLEFLFLGTNYENGISYDVATKYYKDITFLLIVIFNFIIFVVNLLIFSTVEYLSHRHLQINNELFIKSNKEDNDTKLEDGIKKSKKGGFQRKFEEGNELNLRDQVDKNECLIVKNVCKRFNDFKAVKHFNCNFYKGQIFVLLGENGAGKSTLLNMISGRLSVDKGEIMLDYNNLVKNKAYLYSNLGLCLQEDIYFEEMTVKEQLDLICNIKLSQAKIKHKKNYLSESDHLIEKLGLKEFKDTKGKNLSGGNLRKLCVAFALIGRSKLIILDEPSSGMDFKSKKQFWDFLKSVKKDKIMIITTHSMEEAEYLGDTIGIMAEGELICKGSSPFLKNSYPCGYNINFILKRNEVSFREKAELIYELKQIEPLSVIKVLGKDLIKINFPESSLKEKKINQIFKKIELVKDKYKIQNYTVATTSLEDVFFKVNDNEFTRNLFEKELKDVMERIEDEYRIKGKQENPELQNESESILSHSDEYSEQLLIEEVKPNNEPEVIELTKKEGIEESSRPTMNSEDKKVIGDGISITSLIQSDVYPGSSTYSQSILRRHLRRLITTAKRRYVYLIVQLIICSIFLVYTIVLKPMGLSKYFYFNYVRDYYPKSFKSYYQIDNQIGSGNISDYMEEPYVTLEPSTILKDQKDYQRISGSYNFESMKHYMIIENTEKCLRYINFYSPASPAIMHVIVNSVLIKYLSNLGIQTFLLDGYTLSPQAFTSQNVEKFSYNTIITSLISISHLICCSFFINIPIEDKEKEIKTLITLNMGELHNYWLSFFIYHYVRYFIFSLVCYIIISFQIHEIFSLFPVSLFYGVNYILLAYLFTFLFSKGKYAISWYLIFNMILILLTLYLQEKSFIEFEMGYSLSAYDLWTTTAFTHLLFEIRQNQLVINKYITSTYFLKMFMGIGISLMHTGLLIIILFCYENGLINRCLYSFKKKFCQKKETEESDLPEDEDERKHRLLSVSFSSNNNPNLSLSVSEDSVLREKERVTTSQNLFTFLIKNLSVIYKHLFGKDTKAVNQLYMALEANEKFALMGYNGSGKTSVIKSISNSIEKEDNSVIEFLGVDVNKNFYNIRNKIGYCPQINALFDYLTVKETFEFFNKGLLNISEKNEYQPIEENFNEKLLKLLVTFGLFKYKDVLTKNLSGGNKRKVLFAIALMNNPQLALLDEPSTGVDPDSRRLMWKNITSIHRAKKNLGYNFNLIVSTQSFEEAEVLCDSIGWMEKGNFAYIGNSENLKLQLSEGYYLKIRFKKPSDTELNDLINNPMNFCNLDQIEDIQRINIEKIKQEKKYETLFYVNFLDEFVGILSGSGAKLKLLDYLLNEYLLLLEINPRKKGYIFANLLNIKNIRGGINEISIGIQPFETFIEGKSK